MSTTRELELKVRYGTGTASTYELEDVVAEILRDLANGDSELAATAASRGYSAEEFVGARASVDQESKGFGDVIVLITITSPAINHALRTLWDELVLPKLKSDLGADALGDEGDEDNDDEDEDEDEA